MVEAHRVARNYRGIPELNFIFLCLFDWCTAGQDTHLRCALGGHGFLGYRDAIVFLFDVTCFVFVLN